MDNLTKEQRIRNMKAIKSSGNKIEEKIAKLLFSKGYRYRKNDKNVYGKPDLTFKKYKLAVFIDGEFWHGKNFSKDYFKKTKNKEYWINKIQNNILRDEKVNNYLKNMGWIVLRFWENDVKKNLDNCITKFEQTVNSKQQWN